MTWSAIYRMMNWYDALRRLSHPGKAYLASRVQGHPRAVEFLDDAIGHQLEEYEDLRGRWTAPRTEEAVERETEELIAPALPKVDGRLREDLLLKELWTNVLDELSHRMLFRATVLVRPWDWDLMLQLGELGETEAETSRRASWLRNTSLIGEEEVMRVMEEGEEWQKRYLLHPMTAAFIRSQFEAQSADAMDQETCLRVGIFLEERREISKDLADWLDAGHYLFECGEFDRSSDLLGYASQWLQVRGKVLHGLSLLERFDDEAVLKQMSEERPGQLLGTTANGWFQLGQVEKAIKYNESALEIQREIGDGRGEGSTLGNLGVAYDSLGQVEKAIEYHEQALEISREIGDRRGEGSDLGNLGNAYRNLGKVEKARGLYEQCLAIAREIKDPRMEQTVLKLLKDL